MTTPRWPRLRRWAPAIVWAAFIFTCSSLPGTTYPSTDLPNADKLVHIVLYGVLAALAVRGLAVPAEQARSALRLWLVAAAVAALYGVTDELHQIFIPFRSADVEDAVADAAGALLGAGLAVAYRRWRKSAR
jgi:VanZ family protein